MKKLGVFIAGFLTIILALASITSVSAQEPPPPLLYIEAPTSVPLGSNFNVYLWIRDIPSGWEMFDFSLHLTWDPNDLRYVGDEFLDPDGPGGWSGGGVLNFPGDWTAAVDGPQWTQDWAWFRVELECLRPGTTTIIFDSPSVELQMGAAAENTDPDPVSVTVKQGNPVGGIFYSADKLGLLSPWIAAISIIGCIAIISFVAKKRRA